ncbi:hypothetical protein LCGC14_2701650, partial [marine sediment metagenome]
ALDSLRKKGIISSYKVPEVDLNHEDKISMTLKGFMFFESFKPFYDREITNILYNFLDLCNNIEKGEFSLTDSQISLEQLQTYFKQKQNIGFDFTKLYFLLNEIKSLYLTDRFHGYVDNPQRLIFKFKENNILNTSGLSCLDMLEVEKERFLPIEIEKLIVIPLFEINIERHDPHKEEVQELLEGRILTNQTRLIQLISNNFKWLLDPVCKKELKEYMIKKKTRMHFREYSKIIKAIAEQLINSGVLKDNEKLQNLIEIYLEYHYEGPGFYNVKFRTDQSIRHLSEQLSKSFNSHLRVDLPYISWYSSVIPKIYTSHCTIKYGFECHLHYIEVELPLRNIVYFEFRWLDQEFPNKWDDLSEQIKVGIENIISEMRRHFHLDLIEINGIPEEISNYFRKDLYFEEKTVNQGKNELGSNLLDINSSKQKKKISEIKEL